MKSLFTLLFFLSIPYHSLGKTLGVVQVPLCDLRGSTNSAIPNSYAHDPDEESQLLYGEPVEIFSEWDGWLKVEAPEQLEFTHQNRWQGYPGWVRKEKLLIVKKLKDRNIVVQKKSAKLYEIPTPKSNYINLSIGTRLAGKKTIKNGFIKIKTVQGRTGWIRNSDIRFFSHTADETSQRDMIIESAKELLGDPYFWGGRSSRLDLKDQITGVDCSGLIHIVYSVAGKSVPRDSHEQFLKSTRIQREKLKRGDLIFTANISHPEKIIHVALFLDTDRILEGPQTGENVRIIGFEEKFGLPLEFLEDGKTIGDRIIYFGTYFP